MHTGEASPPFVARHRVSAYIRLSLGIVVFDSLLIVAFLSHLLFWPGVRGAAQAIGEGVVSMTLFGTPVLALIGLVLAIIGAVRSSGGKVLAGLAILLNLLPLLVAALLLISFALGGN